MRVYSYLSCRVMFRLRVECVAFPVSKPLVQPPRDGCTSCKSLSVSVALRVLNGTVRVVEVFPLIKIDSASAH